MSAALERILEVSRRLAASADLCDILSQIIDAMRDVLDAERATVFQFDADTNELVTAVAHGVGAGEQEAAPLAMREIRIPVSAGLAGECARTRRIVCVNDAYADARFNPEVDRRSGFRTRSILTIPLIDHDGQLVGVAQVLNKRQGSFDTDDERMADSLAAHAAVALRRGQLIEDRLVRLRLESELRVAREIQKSSFPSQMPPVDGFDIAAWNEPASETGGDAYDLIEAASGAQQRRIVLLMADATGHGVGPAISVTQLRSMARMAVRLGRPLPDILAQANAQLCEDLPPGRFITVWLGDLEPGTGTMHSLSAGQGPLLLYRAATSAIEEIAVDVMPLGVMPFESELSPQTIVLQRGDVLAVLSDGFFEACNRAGEMFRAERVEAILRDTAKAGSDSHAIIAALQSATFAFLDGASPQDDQTAIIVRRV